jgi:hypothetical protein
VVNTPTVLGIITQISGKASVSLFVAGWEMSASARSLKSVNGMKKQKCVAFLKQTSSTGRLTIARLLQKRTSAKQICPAVDGKTTKASV